MKASVVPAVLGARLDTKISRGARAQNQTCLVLLNVGSCCPWDAGHQEPAATLVAEVTLSNFAAPFFIFLTDCRNKS